MEILQNSCLYTERLLLRKLSLNDIDDMYEYTSQEKTCEFLKWEPHKEKIQVEQFISNSFKKKDDLLFGIQLLSQNKLIGVIRLYNFTDNEVDISYILNFNYRGQGYMTEAVKAISQFTFKEFNVNKIYAYFQTNNIASENVMKRSGMKKDFSYSHNEKIKGKIEPIERYYLERSKGDKK